MFGGKKTCGENRKYIYKYLSLSKYIVHKHTETNNE